MIKQRFQRFAIVLMVAMPLTAIKATQIDTFEDLGPDGTLANSRVIDGVTVDMSNTAGVNMIGLSYAPYVTDAAYYSFSNAGVMNQVANPANVSGQRFISTFARNPDNQTGHLNLVGILRFDFSSTVSEFGFTTLDVLEAGNAAANFALMNAYDNMGNLLDSMELIGAQGGDGLDLDWLVSSASGDIAYVEFSANLYNSAYGIDDMVVTAASVPEPEALALFAIGLMGLGFARKKAI